MSNGWTDERRAKQAKAIKKWKPWQKSTGAKSENGKKVCKMNALKHGAFSKALKHLNHLIS